MSSMTATHVKSVSTSLPENLHRELVEDAAASDRSPSAQVRRIIREYYATKRVEDARVRLQEDMP